MARLGRSLPVQAKFSVTVSPTHVLIEGRYLAPDGSPESGYVEVAPNASTLSGLVPSRVRRTLNGSGAFSVTVRRCPAGYTVYEHVGQAVEAVVHVPDQSTVIDLKNLSGEMIE